MATTGVILSLHDFLPGIAAEPDAAGAEFFENKIRPILVDRCYSCHSSEARKVKGGLLLDTREGLLKGGDDGPAVVPGDPEGSLLIKAVRYADPDLQMPPKNKKLKPEQIAALEAWVKMGAPDPRSTKATASGPPLSDPAQVRTHWAFQPATMPAIPRVKNTRWVQTPIDAFVLAKLESMRLAPSRQADKRTLIRRATFDLIGLPPTPAEVEAFLADASADAFARVVDRLLASPEYGERWARYWLDVARYADTKGYVFEEERRYPYAYTYRDYVIRAFNQDLPYNRFILEQLAADQLDLGKDKRPLAALGFLTLGRRFLNNQADIIDDRIDVVSRGLMGLTVGCARCHDHKYDPIPTRDYYSLYGVFASCYEPDEKPLLGVRGDPKAVEAYEGELKKRETELKVFQQGKEDEHLGLLRRQAGDYLLAVHDAQELTDASKREALAKERKLDYGVVERWMSYLEARRQRRDPVFTPWFAFAALPKEEFAGTAGFLTKHIATQHGAEHRINPLVALAFAGSPPASLKDVAERYGALFGEAETLWHEMANADKAREPSKAQGELPAPVALADTDQEALRQVLYAEDGPANLPRGELHRLFDVPSIQKLRALRRRVDELNATSPGAPARAMALYDKDSPEKPHVFMRGNANNPGPEVPRQFLEVVAGPARKPFQKGSGRLELAEAIAGPNNPLTARVIVNRIWLHHFGAGLVRTPSDFGMRADPPTHPELLDFLASRFVADGWSIKQLHRLILLSSVYQQSSDDNAAYAQIDPANRWLWRMSRRRLDFEAMRDSLLAIVGRLDLQTGGQPVDVLEQESAPRRTVYGFIDRQNLPGLLRAFDFASPDSSSPQRYDTTVPQQALFMMNSPFVIHQARYWVERPEFKARQRDEQRVRFLYELAYQREPAPEEVKLACQFVHRRSQRSILPEPSAWQYGYGVFSERTKRVEDYRPLPHFTGEAWQGGARLPDEKLGWLMLNAKGGHPGNDAEHAAIRRWIAPRDGVLRIDGTLSHDSDKGDGVEGRIVSSRLGELGHWLVRHRKERTKVDRVEVKKGDLIDFVTSCRKTVDDDAFGWAPTLDQIEAQPTLPIGSTAVWNAREDFVGPQELPEPLNAWERYAQALLMSNELVFVD
ncbi:MAG: PSD1 and planctomycete cytochrome C domain-containing protein [Limisphaerales bacterium]